MFYNRVYMREIEKKKQGKAKESLEKGKQPSMNNISLHYTTAANTM